MTRHAPRWDWLKEGSGNVCVGRTGADRQRPGCTGPQQAREGQANGS